MKNIPVTILYRVSDAENRTYSLLERLDAGKYLVQNPTEPDAFISAKYLFLNALHVIFNTRLFNNSFFDDNASSLRKIDKHLGLRIAGLWNLYAWVEALSLFWLNWATHRYDPLKDDLVSTVASQVHIAVAGLFYSIAKTVNLIATPLTILLLSFAALAFGFTPFVIAFSVAAGLASALSVRYHYKKSIELDGDDDHSKHLGLAFKLFAQSIFLGAVQSLSRLAQRARDLYHTHPYLFWASTFLVVVSILSFAVFPYVGAPSILGFKLGSFVFELFNPALTKLSEYFVMTTVESAVFKTSITLFTTLGVVDLVTRGCKEISGWLNVFRKFETPINGLTQSLPTNSPSPVVEIKPDLKKPYEPFLISYTQSAKAPTIIPYQPAEQKLRLGS